MLFADVTFVSVLAYGSFRILKLVGFAKWLAHYSREETIRGNTVYVAIIQEKFFLDSDDGLCIPRNRQIQWN